jgi:hypothetical protein
MNAPQSNDEQLGFLGDTAFPMSFKIGPNQLHVAVGLTKRELFAAMALQGMLSSDMSTDRTKANKPRWAKAAVEFADELLAALRVSEDSK